MGALLATTSVTLGAVSRESYVRGDNWQTGAVNSAAVDCMTSGASAVEGYETAPPDTKEEIANSSYLDVEILDLNYEQGRIRVGAGFQPAVSEPDIQSN